MSIMSIMSIIENDKKQREPIRLTSEGLVAGMHVLVPRTYWCQQPTRPDEVDVTHYRGVLYADKGKNGWTVSYFHVFREFKLADLNAEQQEQPIPATMLKMMTVAIISQVEYHAELLASESE